MKVDFKIEGMEKAEELMKQIEEKKMELSNLCFELGKCFWNVSMEVKEQPQEAVAQNEEKVSD